MSRRPVVGKTVVITGASRGIGAALAVRLAADGARLALIGRDHDALTAVAARCGPQATMWPADVTDEAGLAATIAKIADQHDGIDVAVTNAGVCEPDLLQVADPGAEARVVEVNLLGTLRTARLCLPHLIASEGYLLTVSSVSALIPIAGLTAYSATKAACAQLATTLRAETGHLGVAVGTAYLSLVSTDMLADWHRHATLGPLPIPWPVRNTISVEAAADALAAAISRRAKAAYAPRWVRPLHTARAPLAPVVERIGARFGTRAEHAAQLPTLEHQP